MVRAALGPKKQPQCAQSLHSDCRVWDGLTVWDLSALISLEKLGFGTYSARASHEKLSALISQEKLSFGTHSPQSSQEKLGLGLTMH